MREEPIYILKTFKNRKKTYTESGGGGCRFSHGGVFTTPRGERGCKISLLTGRHSLNSLH